MPSQYVKKYPDGRRQTVACQQCGKSFEVHNRTVKRGCGKFCSLECKAAAQRNTLTAVCQNCGRPFSVEPSAASKGNGKYCSWECRRAGMRGEGNPNWKNDPDYRGYNWREIRLAALERDGRKCVKCGASESLVVHHIVPWPETQDNRLENLLTLCIGCHKRTHADLNRR